VTALSRCQEALYRLSMAIQNNQALTVFVLGSVAAKKYPVVADPATEKAAFEDSRKTVTPEDVVRDFLQELAGM